MNQKRLQGRAPQIKGCPCSKDRLRTAKRAKTRNGKGRLVNILASIIYLTKDGGDTFKKSLNAVLSQKADFEFEVIAVDSGSSDGTLEFLENSPVRLYRVPEEEFNFGLTRDFGFRSSRGRILIALSQDAVPVGTDWLRNMVSPFEDESVGVVQGVDILPGEEDLFYWDKISLFYFTRDCKKWMDRYRLGLSFTSCGIRRTVWEANPLGPVEMSEDKLFQKRIVEKGFKIYFQAKALDYHAHRYNVKSLAARCENEGLGWRGVDIRYTFQDMIKDIFDPVIFRNLKDGIKAGKIKRWSELFFPLIRPIWLFKGNLFTRRYVK